MDILETSDDWTLKTYGARNLLEKYGIPNAKIREIISNEDSKQVQIDYYEERQGFFKQLFFGRHENNFKSKVVLRRDLISEMKLQEVLW
ncbi:MAG: hypothetical protein KDC67_12700 [Ignavibacteriae bacterium]|nr:hypothetical protein [Ignavibacteriota bacterium]